MKTHAAASWLMATCCSLIAMAPRRCEGSAFVVTLKAMFAFPCPEDPAPNCIQLLEDVALHEHSRFVLTVRVPPPPPAPNVAGSATAVTWHLEVEGPVTFWVDEVQASHEPHVRITPTAGVSARISALGVRGESSVLARACTATRSIPASADPGTAQTDANARLRRASPSRARFRPSLMSAAWAPHGRVSYVLTA